MNYLTSVQCTWKVPEGQKLINAITISETKNSQDIEDVIQPENCILLKSPEDSGNLDYLLPPSCQLLLTSNDQYPIATLSLISEARLVEVYGHHGEYLQTVKTDLIEETDDIFVFRGDIVFDHPLKVCSLKFSPLRAKNEMWLFGLKVIVDKQEITPNVASNFPMEEIERRLSDMGIKLTDKAESFKQIFEKFSSFGENSAMQAAPLIQMLALAANQNKSISPIKTETVPSTNGAHSNFLASPIEASSASPPTEESIPAARQSVSPMNGGSSVLGAPLIAPFEEALSEMESRLVQHIDSKMKEQDRLMKARMQQMFKDLEQNVMCKLDEVVSTLTKLPQLNRQAGN